MMRLQLVSGSAAGCVPVGVSCPALELVTDTRFRTDDAVEPRSGWPTSFETCNTPSIVGIDVSGEVLRLVDAAVCWIHSEFLSHLWRSPDAMVEVDVA